MGLMLVMGLEPSAWVNIGAILAAGFIGLGGAVVSARIVSKNTMAAVRQEAELTDARELKAFYSWVLSILDDLRKKQGNRVRDKLATNELHYAFGKIWARIPEADSDGLPVRALIYEFLVSGRQPLGFFDHPKFEQLVSWLSEHSK